MATHKVMPPSGGGVINIMGRRYECDAFETVDMPEGDAVIAASNGWRIIPDWAAPMLLEQDYPISRERRAPMWSLYMTGLEPNVVTPLVFEIPAGGIGAVGM